MSNGKMYTGKSADGSDMMEMGAGVYEYGDGQWGNIPLPGSEHVRTKLDRMIEELAAHLVDNERTVEEEYALIQQKKSQLSKRMRDFVVVAYAMEQAKSDNEESKEENNKEETKGSELSDMGEVVSADESNS